jgi:Do/DeqQ family serine protease
MIFLRVNKTAFFRTVAVTGIALAALALGACKGSFLEQAENAPVNEPNTQSPPAPVVVDGARTSYADIVEKVAPAVVTIGVKVKAKQTNEGGSPFGFPFEFPGQQRQQQPRQRQGIGSGVIVSSDGTILTNNHVVEGAEKVTVVMNDKSRRTFEAKIIGTDKLTDLAVIKIEADNLPFLTLGDSDKARVGDVILAIGNPLGVGQTVTSGIISALGRQTNATEGGYENFIQIDAPINQGNSGGALVNVNGELIGINSQILTAGGFMGSGGNIGIGYSIPSNMAKNVMDQLLKDGKVRRGQLGVIIQDINPDLAKEFDLKEVKGVIVSDINKGSAAEKAGVSRGDVIVSFNGERVEDSNSLRNKVAATAPGSDVRIAVLRDGAEKEFSLKLDEASVDGQRKPDSSEGESKSEPGSDRKLGIEVEPLSEEVAKRLDLPANTKGLVITGVDQSGPAGEAGINEGDVIVEVNRTAVSSVDDMRKALEKSQDKALLLISRRGRTIFIPVNLGN